MVGGFKQYSARCCVYQGFILPAGGQLGSGQLLDEDTIRYMDPGAGLLNYGQLEYTMSGGGVGMSSDRIPTSMMLVGGVPYTGDAYFDAGLAAGMGAHDDQPATSAGPGAQPHQPHIIEESFASIKTLVVTLSGGALVCCLSHASVLIYIDYPDGSSFRCG